jgi:hypothetical protein
MHIFALNYSCKRDYALSEMMIDSLVKHGIPYIKQIRSIDTDEHFPQWGNGAGWPASMLKLAGVQAMLADYPVGDDDYILSVDSDVFFTSPDVFDFVKGNVDTFGIIGTTHKPPYETAHGPFGHCSGALIFIRGDIARKMCAIPDHELARIRFEQFKPFVITENEDVVLSYLAMLSGAKLCDLPGSLSSGNFEAELISGELKSYYHLNYSPTLFLGELVSGKWDIPRIIKAKGLEL